MFVALLPLALSFLKKAWPYVLIAGLLVTVWGYRKAYKHEEVKVAGLQAQYQAEHAAAKSCSDATAKVAAELADKQNQIVAISLAGAVAATQSQSRSEQRTTTIEVTRPCKDSLSNLVLFFSQRQHSH